MEPWLYAVIALAALLVLFLAVVLIRTANFKPKKNVKVIEEEEAFDGERAVENLRELIRCKTVSYKDHSLEDDAEFEKLIAKLPELYPNVFKTCTFTRMEDRALLFKWEGKAHDEASVLMAHYDVVPVNEENWDKPPFEAIYAVRSLAWGKS
ncbi:MAG: peptidase M20, partial [Eubacteriales bacterium]